MGLQDTFFAIKFIYCGIKILHILRKEFIYEKNFNDCFLCVFNYGMPK